MLCVWLVHKTLPQQVSTYLSTFLHVASSSDFLFVCLNNVKTWSFFDSIRYNRRDLQNNCKASLELHALAYFAVSGFQLMMSLGIYWKTRKLIFLSISYIWRQLGSITFFSCNSPSPSTDTPPPPTPRLHHAKCLSTMLCGCGVVFDCFYVSTCQEWLV